MNAYTIKGILFDMDGVVIDSNAAIERFWKDWTVKENVMVEEEDIVKYIHGRTTQDTIDTLFRQSDKIRKSEILAAAVAFDLNMRPGLIKGAGQFLKALPGYLQNIALVTSAPLKRAKKMLDLHDVYTCFSCTITGDEVKNGKPDPEPYLRGAAKLHVAPAHCLVFEDSNSGILSALSAGMCVIAVNNLSYKHRNIIAHINSFEELSLDNKVMYINNQPIQIHLG